MSNQHPSIVSTLLSYALVGGAAVAAVAFGAGPLGEAITKMGWGGVAESVGKSLIDLGKNTADVGTNIMTATHFDKLDLAKSIDSRLAIIFAGALGAGSLAALVNVATNPGTAAPSGLPHVPSPGSERV